METPTDNSARETPLRGIFPSTDNNPLYAILSNWLWLTHKYVDARSYLDAPWFHSERTALGMLAAAAWQTDGVALEDYRARRVSTRRSTARQKPTQVGQCDLYFRQKNVDYVCTAGHIAIALNHIGYKGEIKIKNALEAQARAAERAVLTPEERPLGVVLATFEFPRTRSNPDKALRRIRAELLQWDDYLKSNVLHPYSAAAWFMPFQQLALLKKPKQFLPGCAVFIKTGAYGD